MLRRVTISAPGKVILHGEHAVVYGKEAIACSIDKRIHCTVKLEDSSNSIKIKAKSDDKENWGIFERPSFKALEGLIEDVSEPRSLTIEQLSNLKDVISSAGDESSVESKLHLVCLFYYLTLCSKFLRGSNKGLTIDIISELPLGAGIGSSASLCVCLSCAFLMLSRAISPCHKQSKETPFEATDFAAEPLRLVNAWAYEGETLLHGTPSGVDNSIVTYGGMVCFKNKEIENLPWSPNLEVLLVYSKVPRSTLKMVKGVRDRYEKMPRVYNALFDAMECLAQESKTLLLRLGEESEDNKNCAEVFERISDMVDINQNLLRSIGVSHDVIDSILRMLLRFGLKGKLTGGGGGGCVFAVLKPGHNEVQVSCAMEEISRSGYSSWKVGIGGAGVTCVDFEA